MVLLLVNIVINKNKNFSILRWVNVQAKLPNDTYVYSYNPCHKFSLGNSGECKNVEVSICLLICIIIFYIDAENVDI